MIKFIMVFAILSLVGCTERAEPKHMAIAEDMCANNGGVSYIDVGAICFDIRCKNGAYFGNKSKNSNSETKK